MADLRVLTWNSGGEADGRGAALTGVVNMINATLSYELEAFGKALVDAIKKAPAEVRPAALAAALAIISGMQQTADAFVQSLPDYPNSLSAESIKAQAQILEARYQHLPPDAPASAFLPALSLLKSVDEMVDPLSTDPPTFPHIITQRFLDRQASLLFKYVSDNALK